MAEQQLCNVPWVVLSGSTVKDGKITRMRPIIFDETDKGGWITRSQ